MQWTTTTEHEFMVKTSSGKTCYVPAETQQEAEGKVTTMGETVVSSLDNGLVDVRRRVA